MNSSIYTRAGNSGNWLVYVVESLCISILEPSTRVNSTGQANQQQSSNGSLVTLVVVSMQIFGSEIAQKFVAATTTQQYQQQPLLPGLHLSCTVIAISHVYLIRWGLLIASNWPDSHTAITVRVNATLTLTMSFRPSCQYLWSNCYLFSI